MDRPHLPPPPAIHRRGGRWTPGAGPAAVTVGNFDGVHLGHASIIRRLRAAADRVGVPAVAVTFDPHPASILRPGTAPATLTTPARRAELLLELGVDAVLVQPVDAALVALSAEDFYRWVLRDLLRAAAIVEGKDFRFGAGRRGTVELLAGLCGRDGVSFEVVEPVAVGDAVVSSSRIRELVAAGDVTGANRLLTAPFRLSGVVVQGARRGATLGFPTANLADVATLVPAGGVYAARATTAAAESLPAAVHVGPNVSFGAAAITVEAHLIGFTGDLYGSRLDVDFLARLRDTRRFDSVDALTAQLSTDVARARETVRAAAVPAGSAMEP